MVKGTVGEIRSRTLQILLRCGVEMLIIDEADRLKPKTFADVRDFFDNLGISVVLVGTDRLQELGALWHDGKSFISIRFRLGGSWKH